MTHPDVDAYLDTLPPAVRARVVDVRAALHAALPGAEERISYGIPTLSVGGRMALYFAGFKGHWSLYPITPAMEAAAPEAVAARRAGRGTLRFDPAEPVPFDLLHTLATARLTEITAELAAKRARTPRRRAATAGVKAGDQG